LKRIFTALQGELSWLEEFPSAYVIKKKIEVIWMLWVASVMVSQNHNMNDTKSDNDTESNTILITS